MGLITGDAHRHRLPEFGQVHWHVQQHIVLLNCLTAPAFAKCKGYGSYDATMNLVR